MASASSAAEDFKSSLCDLTVNSKPLISMLTMLAEENQKYAKQIVDVIENHVYKAKPTEKLPALYLIDSILKNIRHSAYTTCFTQNIVNIFCHVFDEVEERTRQSMFKLRQTWGEVLPARKLYALDVRVNQLDPAWPVVAVPADLQSSKAQTEEDHSAQSGIHINPKFLQQQNSNNSMEPSPSDMASELANKQSELMKIKQMQMELELAKAKAQLAKQTREIELLRHHTETASVQSQPVEATPSHPADPRVPDSRSVTRSGPDSRVAQNMSDPRLSSHQQSANSMVYQRPGSDTIPHASRPFHSAGVRPLLIRPLNAPPPSRNAIMGAETEDNSARMNRRFPPRDNEPFGQREFRDRIMGGRGRARGIRGMRGGDTWRGRGGVGRDMDRQLPVRRRTPDRPLPYPVRDSADSRRGGRLDRDDRRRRRSRSRSRSSSDGEASKERRKKRERDHGKETDKSHEKSNEKPKDSSQNKEEGKPEPSVERKEETFDLSKGKSTDANTSDVKTVFTSSVKDEKGAQEDVDLRQKQSNSSEVETKSMDTITQDSSSTQKDSTSAIVSVSATGDLKEEGSSIKSVSATTSARSEPDFTVHPAKFQKTFAGKRAKPDIKISLAFDGTKKRSKSPAKKNLGSQVLADIKEKTSQKEAKKKASSSSAEAVDEKEISTDAQKFAQLLKGAEEDVDLRQKQPVKAGAEDMDHRQKKPVKERKRTDSLSPKPVDRKKARSKSPAKASESAKKKVILPSVDQDMRLPAKDKEDAKLLREKRSAEQWQSSRAIQMPRIPRKKTDSRVYRQRGDSPVSDKTQESGSKDAPPLKELKISSSEIGDKDMRSLPVVKAEVKQLDSDSSDSGAEEREVIEKRRQDRKKLLESSAVSSEDTDLRGNASGNKKKVSRRKRSPTYEEDEKDIDLRIRPPIKQGKREDEDLRKKSNNAPSPLRKFPNQSSSDKESSNIKNRKGEIPQSPGAHAGWNQLKKDNPKNFYTPKPMDRQRSSSVERGQGGMRSPLEQEMFLPGFVNDKGLEMLDRKNEILETARKQLRSGEINQKQFDEVKHRIQELQLIKRSREHKLSNFGGNRPMNVTAGDPRQRSSAHASDNRPPLINTNDPRLRGNMDPKILQLLKFAAENKDDPRVQKVLGELTGNQGTTKLRMPTGPRGPLLSTPVGPAGLSLNTMMRPGVRTASNMGPRGILPFNMQFSQEPRPNVRGMQQFPQGMRQSGPMSSDISKPQLSRTHSIDKGKDVPYRVIIDDCPYELTLGLPPRRIRIGQKMCHVQADKENREILIDGVCYYRLGEPVRDVYIKGQRHSISYQGPPANLWIDGLQYDVRIDSPPKSIQINGSSFEIQVYGRTNKLFIDGQDTGPFGGPKRSCKIGDREHTVQFDPPARDIQIDGKLCKLKFDGPTPVVLIDGKQHGIRFDGPPREIIIDDTPYLVPMDRPIRVKVGMRAHMLAFGGPGHEVIVDGKPYEILFNGPPRQIKIGGNLRNVKLVGESPDVKILGEVFLLEESAMEAPPLPPFMTQTQSHLQPNQIGPRMMTRPHGPNAQPQFPMAAPAIPGPSAAPPVDVGTLFNQLMAHGIITSEKKEAEKSEHKKEQDKLQEVPDLTDLSESKLTKSYDGVTQRLYSGNQCTTCGLRFPLDADSRYGEHLDWHFRQNRKEKSTSIGYGSRRWYFLVSDWISYEEFSDINDSNVFLTSEEQLAEESASSVPAVQLHPDAISCPRATDNEKDDRCCVCGDQFDRYWDDDDEDWHLKDAIRIDDKTYHPVCYEDACETCVLDSTPNSEPATPTAADILRSVGLTVPLPEQSEKSEKTEPNIVSPTAQTTVKSEPPDTLTTTTTAVVPAVLPTSASAQSNSQPQSPSLEQTENKPDALTLLSSLLNKSVKPAITSAPTTPVSAIPPSAIVKSESSASSTKEIKEVASTKQTSPNTITSVASAQLSAKTSVSTATVSPTTEGHPITAIGSISSVDVPQFRLNAPFTRGPQPLLGGPSMRYGPMRGASSTHRGPVPHGPMFGGPQSYRNVRPPYNRPPYVGQMPPMDGTMPLMGGFYTGPLHNPPPPANYQADAPAGENADDDEGTPVRDERDDDRSGTPVLDEPNEEDGGSTPVRDEPM